MAGIAEPGGFRRLVERLGAVVVDQIDVRDHAPFRRRHFRRAARFRPDLLLCTEKDQVRVPHPELVALGCVTELLAGEVRLGRALEGAFE
jgi:tetraacyldisaccharide-1-P 4'-kinase